MSTDTDQAYRDGRVDATLEQHTEHLAAINGSVDRTARALAELVDAVQLLRSDFNAAEQDRKTMGPIVEMMMEDRKAAIVVASTLAKKTDEAKTRWEGWRVKAAWGLGVITAIGATANFIFRMLGVPS